VMIEAVENHNPEVIIIDEIGRELEAQAARTIAERGVQLIATAHGNTLDNLLLNPTLSDLVGGIESVTLSDEEARRRGTQKAILERRAPPTFDVLVEIQDRQQLLIRHSVADAVDGLLRGRPPQAELRYRDEGGEVQSKMALPLSMAERQNGRAGTASHETKPPQSMAPRPATGQQGGRQTLRPIRVFPYGIARNRLERSARHIQVPAHIVKDMAQAEVLITTKAFYRKRPRLIVDAERRGLPIYVMRANTVSQMNACLSDLFELEEESGDDVQQALQEAEQAVQQVLEGAAEVELPPQNAYVRRLQHELARAASLESYSAGEEPRRCVHVRRG
jgi:hypothetical protein